MGNRNVRPPKQRWNLRIGSRRIWRFVTSEQHAYLKIYIRVDGAHATKNIPPNNQNTRDTNAVYFGMLERMLVV
jgi:hypothetical protein